MKVQGGMVDFTSSSFFLFTVVENQKKVDIIGRDGF